MTDTNQHTTCLLCGSKDLRVLDRYAKDHLVRCGNCSFIFCQQIPTKEELINFYSDNYDRTSYLSPITVKRYEELLASFEPFRKTGKILDVGAGYGFFLEIAKRKGWEVYGTELTDEAIHVCEHKGFQMFKGEFQEYTCEPDTFDVIVSIECLEHINNPIEYVKMAHCLLRPGGKFYLTTPNWNSYLRKRLKEQYDVIEYPNHLSYYTPKTLKKLFRENGFRAKKLATTGISITRLKTSKGKSNQEYVSETSDDEMLRYRIEKNPLLKFGKWMANSLLNSSKTGDSIKAHFIKM